MTPEQLRDHDREVRRILRGSRKTSWLHKIATGFAAASCLFVLSGLYAYFDSNHGPDGPASAVTAVVRGSPDWGVRWTEGNGMGPDFGSVTMQSRNDDPITVTKVVVNRNEHCVRGMVSSSDGTFSGADKVPAIRFGNMLQVTSFCKPITVEIDTDQGNSTYTLGDN